MLSQEDDNESKNNNIETDLLQENNIGEAPREE